MKKAFTLIELLIVVVIIGILLISTLRLGWDYIFGMQFRIEKEDFVSTYYSALSRGMSSIYDRDMNKCDDIIVGLSDTSSSINISSSTTGCNISTERILNKSYFSGFLYSGTRYSSGNFVIEPYKFGCYMKSGLSRISTGTVSFQLISEKVKNKYCFDVDLGSCKMKEYGCK